MGAELVIHNVREALMAAFWLAAPLLLLGFVVSIITNLFQIATSLQDSSFSAFPRLVAFLFGAIALLPWMVQKAVTYATAVFVSLARYGQ
jgi:flagellar biosynthesis protein FliQ